MDKSFITFYKWKSNYLKMHGGHTHRQTRKYIPKLYLKNGIIATGITVRQIILHNFYNDRMSIRKAQYYIRHQQMFLKSCK